MAELKPISVLFADDHAVVREGFVALCSQHPSLRVVGQCADGVAALQMIQATAPDFAFLDLDMPKLSGIELIRKLRQEGHSGKLVILSMNRNEFTAALALREGADGYVVKGGPFRHVLDAIHYIGDGGTYFSPVFPPDLLARDRTRVGADPLSALSGRERQVFYSLVEGVRPKEIAALLNVSPKTVDTYRAGIMRKLGIHDLVSLVKFAINHNLTTASQSAR